LLSNNSLDNRVTSEPSQNQAELDTGLPSQSTNDALDPQWEILLSATTSQANNAVSTAPTSCSINGLWGYQNTLCSDADFLNTSAGPQSFFHNASFPFNGKILAEIFLCQYSGSYVLTNTRL
jgi:hypothetical protein